MKKSEAYNKIVEEYLSKCKYCGCDGCIAQFYCISNGLRTDRYPQKDCSEKVKKIPSATASKKPLNHSLASYQQVKKASI